MFCVRHNTNATGFCHTLQINATVVMSLETALLVKFADLTVNKPKMFNSINLSTFTVVILYYYVHITLK